jgi:hypothetical protein
MKRRWLGLLLLGVGAFLLVAGIMATAWVPGVVKKTPLDVNQQTHLDGTVAKIDLETGELVENPVKILDVTQTDSNASDDDVVVWGEKTCVVIDTDNPPDCVDGDDPRLVDASTDVFATDRVTAEAVNDFSGLPADATPHEGLINKWPFDAQKKTYTYWEGMLNEGVPAVYDRTEDVAGIETYVYKVTTTDAKVEIVPDSGIQGTYDDVKEIYVEPKTGAIQQQTESQQRYLEDGTQVLDLNIKFTDEQIQQFKDDAKANMRLLSLLTVWLPIVGYTGGTLCVIAGLAILILGRRRDESSVDVEKQAVAAS